MNDEKQAAIGFLLWVHFPNLGDDLISAFPGVLCCEICEDFRQGVCPGEGRQGQGVIDCMAEGHGEFEFENNFCHEKTPAACDQCENVYGPCIKSSRRS